MLVKNSKKQHTWLTCTGFAVVAKGTGVLVTPEQRELMAGGLTCFLSYVVMCDKCS